MSTNNGKDRQRVADTCVIPPTIFDLNEASIFLDLSPNSILKKVKAGKFPQPVLVGGPNSWEAGWFYKDLIAYKTTYIDPIRDLQRGPDSAKAGSGPRFCPSLERWIRTSRNAHPTGSHKREETE